MSGIYIDIPSVFDGIRQYRKLLDLAKINEQFGSCVIKRAYVHMYGRHKQKFVTDLENMGFVIHHRTHKPHIVVRMYDAFISELTVNVLRDIEMHNMKSVTILSYYKGYFALQKDIESKSVQYNAIGKGIDIEMFLKEYDKKEILTEETLIG